MKMLSPTDQKPTVTNLVARCRACGVEWQVRGGSDTMACNFCGAGKAAIAVENEEFSDGRR